MTTLEFSDELKLERMASNGEKEVMKKRRFSEEQMVTIPREAGKGPVAEARGQRANHLQLATAFRQAGGGRREATQAARARDARLKEMLAERDLELAVMKEINAKNVWSAPVLQAGFSGETLCVNVSGLSRVSCFWQQGHDGICALVSQ